jgi:cytosine/adenosine deaminase-related metal-dependent hydrolase
VGRIDAEAEYAAARTGLAELALSGCTRSSTTTTSSRGPCGLWEAEVQAARELGVRIVASRGSMDLGESDGGLPPDSLVESIDDVLAETERLAGLQDDDGLVQLAVAPCSPFSVTKELMVESAALARRLGLRLHTHLPRRSRRTRTARAVRLPAGRVPAELGWVAGDVWCAHCVHLSAEDVGRSAGRRRRRALPDLEPAARGGVAPVRELVDAGAPVGLGVDGSASNERSDLFFEVKQALLVARGRGGPRGDDGARGAAAGHARRRRRARPRRHRAARAGQARGHRRLADRRPRARRRGGRPGRRAWSLGTAPRRPASTSAATRSSATATSSEPTRTRSPASTASVVRIS